jgi:HEAT repeat protein
LNLRAERCEQNPPLADWLVALSHDSPFERPPAGAPECGAFPPLTAVQSILSLLKGADRNVRLAAVKALGDLVGEIRRVLPAICAELRRAALNDPDDGVRAEVVRALLQAGPQPATDVGALVDALRSDIDVVRFHAAVALGNSGSAGRPAVPALIRSSLWDEEPGVRVEAAVALWKIDGQTNLLVLDVLIKALDDANELICWIAADCLGQMGRAAREAIPALRQALRRDFRISLIKTGVLLALERIEAPATAG